MANLDLNGQAQPATPPPPEITHEPTEPTPSIMSSDFPPTPGRTVDGHGTELDRTLKIHTPSPTPHAYAKFLYDLHKNGYGEPVATRVTRKPLKRPISEGEKRIPDWVEAAKAASAVGPALETAPPYDRPLSPTAGAPFMPQSERLKRQCDETHASHESLAGSSSIYGADQDDPRGPLIDDFPDPDDFDHDEITAGRDPGPSLTGHQHHGTATPVNEEPTVKVTPYEELTEGMAHPQDLSEQLQADVAALRRAAQGMDDMLEKIAELEADVIIVIEMAKKLDRRVYYLEQRHEDHLPELEDEKADAAFLKSLNYRIIALEQVIGPIATGIQNQYQHQQYQHQDDYDNADTLSSPWG